MMLPTTSLSVLQPSNGSANGSIWLTRVGMTWTYFVQNPSNVGKSIKNPESEIRNPNGHSDFGWPRGSGQVTNQAGKILCPTVLYQNLPVTGGK